MAYDHELYLSNCRKMIPLNEQKVRDTQAQIKRTGDPKKKAILQEELDGWVNWVAVWKQRLKDAEDISKGDKR